MRKKLTRALMVAAVLIVAGSASAAAASKSKQINGAGATFPYPIYSKWAAAYHRETGVRVNYQSIGSGGGIKQIKAGTVDFGASDAPLTKQELDAAGLVQFPMIIGGVVPVVNLPGVKPGTLKLTPQTLAGIFLGRIKRWDDPALQELNPELDLPGLPITVVHRSDGSGTTWVFTNYLSKVSSSWQRRVGNAKAVSWPTGVGGKGNEGVASYVARLRGGIGYVEFAYALQNQMNYVLLRNRAGGFTKPSIETFQAAAAGADWAHAPGFYLVLTNQPGQQSWPISGASFILMHKIQNDRTAGRTALEFFAWCFEHGDEMAVDLHYVPLPQSVVDQVENAWQERLVGPNQQPLWTRTESAE
ncbi:MAG: phosphate ABC transporter substrate-binding protein PstS [Nitrococcus mobilis]|nr:phosphate ABC transporter substrate-binding protein PstS [Nitrococcus mobilis]